MSKNESFFGTNFIYCRVLVMVMVMVMVVLVVMVVVMVFLLVVMLVVMLLQAQVVTRTNEGPNLVPANPLGSNKQFNLAKVASDRWSQREKLFGAHQRKGVKNVWGYPG